MSHGLWNHELYPTWYGMMARCYIMSSTSFVHYGAEGIGVCRRWWNVSGFIADMAPRPSGAVLDRINNKRGYSPANCRWVTQAQNCRNKINNVLVDFRGRKVTLIEASEASGISHGLLSYRLKHGQALFSPVRTWNRKNTNEQT